MKISDIICESIIELFEGGAAIKGSVPLTQSEVRQIAPNLLAKIQATLDLPASKVKIIGSAGKKPNANDMSGDIDIAVEASPSDVEEALPKLAKLFSSENKFKAMKGINVYAFACDIGNKFIQVDMMPVEDVKYAAWSYQAHTDDLKQGLKGAHRNELMFAIAKYLDSEVTKKDSEGEAIEIKRYFFDLSKGLMVGTQSRESNKGKVLKNFSTKSKTVLSRDPKVITKKFFGPGVTPEEVSTFYGALEAINSDTFPLADKREKILELARKGIKNKGLKTINF